MQLTESAQPNGFDEINKPERRYEKGSKGGELSGNGKPTKSELLMNLVEDSGRPSSIVM